jgi:predicted nucleic acid-binding protein
MGGAVGSSRNERSGRQYESEYDFLMERVTATIDHGAAGQMVAPDETTARRAGELRYRARSDDGIDALVAAAAVGDGSPAVLLTSDPDDLERLLGSEPQVSVQRV